MASGRLSASSARSPGRVCDVDWTRHAPGPMDVTTCAGCDREITAHDHSLSVQLDGFGDRGMLDTLFDGAVELELCESCARQVLETRWGAKALAYLNINAGHVCAGELVWTPMSECTTDRDRHGWRPVFAAVPHVEGRFPERAPVVGPEGKAPRFSLHDTEADAETAVGALVERGIPARVARTFVGNEAEYAETVTPDEWAGWWPEYNRRWLVEERQRRRRELLRALVRRPVRTGRWLVLAARRDRSGRR